MNFECQALLTKPILRFDVSVKLFMIRCLILRKASIFAIVPMPFTTLWLHLFQEITPRRVYSAWSGCNGLHFQIWEMCAGLGGQLIAQSHQAPSRRGCPDLRPPR
jgi:hypothetical protein